MKKFLLLVVLLLFITPASAQDGDWEVVLFNTVSGNLFAVQPDNTVTTLATATLQPQPADARLEPIALSPDHRYLAITLNYTASLMVVDFHAEGGGQAIASIGEGEEIVDAAFSPDSTKLAVALVLADGSYLGAIRIIDLATFSQTAEIRSDMFPTGVAATLLDWRTDGIYFLPNCWGCEPDLDGTLTRWIPEANQVTDTGEFITLFGRWLPLTGEWLIAEDHPGFPASGEPYIYFPPNNVVTILYPDSPVAEVVYFNPQQLELLTPEWVLDGRAFLISGLESDVAALVYRDGHQVVNGGMLSLRFLAGTPDGWLMTGQSLEGETKLYHYAENADGTITTTEAGVFADPVWLVEAPVLGSSVGGSFPAVPIPAPITCPGALPSRLRANRFGQVLPGDANNLRSEPNANSELVGQIPGEGFFSVLEGPVCADGYAWWRVDYNSVVGWTVEGTGDEYWVEPSE